MKNIVTGFAGFCCMALWIDSTPLPIRSKNNLVVFFLTIEHIFCICQTRHSTQTISASPVDESTARETGNGSEVPSEKRFSYSNRTNYKSIQQVFYEKIFLELQNIHQVHWKKNDNLLTMKFKISYAAWGEKILILIRAQCIWKFPFDPDKIEFLLFINWNPL